MKKNKSKKLIYVAGALSDDTAGYIQNLHRMIKWENKIRKLGFATFCPGYDFLGGLAAGDWEYKDYFENNQPILERCDAVFLVPKWENSKGTKKEIEKANRLNIPIFNNEFMLREYFFHKQSNLS